MGKRRKPPHDPRRERSEFGKRLREVRQRRGVQAADIAERMDVAISTYYSWEEGERMPRDVKRLADVVGTTVGALHGEVPL